MMIYIINWKMPVILIHSVYVTISVHSDVAVTISVFLLKMTQESNRNNTYVHDVFKWPIPYYYNGI